MSSSVYHDPNLWTSKDYANTSPVNFFMPNLEKYPLFSSAKRTFTHLASGDCVFIPAYYFYHLQGFRQLLPNAPGMLAGMFPAEFYAKN